MKNTSNKLGYQQVKSSSLSFIFHYIKRFIIEFKFNIILFLQKSTYSKTNYIRHLHYTVEWFPQPT